MNSVIILDFRLKSVSIKMHDLFICLQKKLNSILEEIIVHKKAVIIHLNNFETLRTEIILNILHLLLFSDHTCISQLKFKMLVCYSVSFVCVCVCGFP